MSLGGEKGEGHAPAHDQPVDRAEEGPQHAELVGDLGPADDGQERAGGAGEQATDDVDLAGQETAAGSTVVEKNLDRITVTVAIVFAFTTVILALRLQ